MADTLKYKPHQRLTYKDLAYLMCLSNRTAQKYLTEIKQHFNVHFITYKHYTTYFKL